LDIVFPAAEAVLRLVAQRLLWARKLYFRRDFFAGKQHVPSQQTLVVTTGIPSYAPTLQLGNATAIYNPRKVPHVPGAFPAFQKDLYT
jgi:hypothetical protein